MLLQVNTSGSTNRYYQFLDKGGVYMNKFRMLAGILIITLFVLGIAAIFCGIWLVYIPAAFIILGIILIVLSLLINQLIPSRKRGD